MNRSAISPGRIPGIPLGLDHSWFLILALLTWSLATSYFPGEFKGGPVTQHRIVGALSTIIMFGSVLLHELEHSMVARRCKILCAALDHIEFCRLEDSNSRTRS